MFYLELCNHIYIYIYKYPLRLSVPSCPVVSRRVPSSSSSSVRPSRHPSRRRRPSFVRPSSVRPSRRRRRRLPRYLSDRPSVCRTSVVVVRNKSGQITQRKHNHTHKHSYNIHIK